MSADARTYVVLCTYGRDALSLRDAAMDEHLSYLRSNRDRLRFAGPLLDNDTRTASGSLAVVEGGGRADAEDYIAREAFCRAGMFDSIEIVRFESAVGLRQAELKPDERRQLYVCRWLTETGQTYRRPPSIPETNASTRMLEGGALLSDEGAQLIGGLLIVETVDRGDAEAVLASDVERSSAGDARTLVSRWRFGQALSQGDGR
jgi:uncharacterized protein YciI